MNKMKKNMTTLNWFLWAVVILVIVSNSAFAADCPTDIAAVTNKDANISVEELAYRVKPLTKCELEVEAQAWLLLLKKKVTEISSVRVAALYKEKEIENVKNNPGNKEAEQKSVQDALVQKAIKAAEVEVKKEGGSIPAADKTPAGKEEIKAVLIKHATILAGERTILVDRFNIVLNELTAKGGMADEYRTYIKAISNIKLDVSDTSATWIAVSSWLTSAEGGFRWAANVIQFIVTMLVFYLLSVASGRLVKKVFAKPNKLSTLLLDFLQIGTRRLVLLIGLFVGLSALEINVGPVLAVVGAAGFVVAFALQNSLSNFASGLLTLIYRPFDIGDLINVAGTLGEVETMNLLSTQLRTPDHQLVVVPNNLVWADTIINVTGIKRRRVDLIFGIGYSDDIDKAQKILEEIVAAHELVLKNPAPIVKLHELADSSVNFICRPWVRPVNYWDVYWDVTREVKRRFDNEGVSIPFPQQDVHFYREAVAEVGDKEK
jgi:small conductance mechanosensitive channel